MSLETCQRANDVTLETATHKELFSGVLYFILSVHENHLKILGFFLRGGFNKRKRFSLSISFVKNCKGKLLTFAEVPMEVLVASLSPVATGMPLLWGEQAVEPGRRESPAVQIIPVEVGRKLEPEVLRLVVPMPEVYRKRFGVPLDLRAETFSKTF